MKKEFSSKWNGSKLPRKQRKYRANASFKVRRIMISANLSKDLRKKYGRRSFPLRLGDKVKIFKGQFKKKEGKVTLIDMYKLKIGIEGIQITKKDGTKVNVKIDPSNLQIIEMNIEDKKREEALKKKIKENKEEKKK